jgi:prevent-host-death family protein
MKTIDIAEATAPLAQYARANRRHTLVVTRRGRPIAALMPITTPADAESFKVNRSPAFQALIAESRRANPSGTGLSTAQVRSALAPRRSRRVRR